MCHQHWYSIGDHQVFVLKISAASLLGGPFPEIAMPKAHLLNSKISCLREHYCMSLKQLTEQQKMGLTLGYIWVLSMMLPSHQTCKLQNKWDTEVGELMWSAERNCNKFKSCASEYSPTVGQWIKRRSILPWILKWHDGKVPDTRNLCRTAHWAGIETPLTLTHGDVEARLQACLSELFQLKLQAPELQRKHLCWQLPLAQSQGDVITERER